MLNISDIFRGGNRQSNIELLRIITMLLVMVVHANFFSLGSPSTKEFQAFPQISITRFFIQSISICCINIFVLIYVTYCYRYSSFNLQGLLQWFI